jgi:beta-lactamase superfamily II metal-dependent hydrolase
VTDFFELDFLDVEAAKSGDAIPLRYQLNGIIYIHVVDGGFQDTGDKVVEHINKYYGNPLFIDRVVVTHPDGDHAGGLRKVLEAFIVKELWMLRPWNYADEIHHRFTNYTSVERLKSRLKQIYPNIAALEEIAVRSSIPIYEPFQGASIGPFKVLAPSRARYLDLIVESERTPESQETSYSALNELLGIPLRKVINFIKGAWGVEVFSPEETSSENEMSVIQYANIAGEKILLTGDAGRGALLEAARYAPYAGLLLPGIDRFQVPHHGSRRNVSTEVLDLWLGARLPGKVEPKFTAIISSAKKDEDHPRKAVVRALWHRGARVLSTEGQSIRTHQNAPDRGWTYAVPLDYPEDQEE